jgi:hypothetical protein
VIASLNLDPSIVSPSFRAVNAFALSALIASCAIRREENAQFFRVVVKGKSESKKK